MEKWKRWTENKWGLFLLLFISLLLKGIAVACSDVVNSDGTLYISAAQEFAEGNFGEGLALYRMPFYPLMIVVSHWFIPQWVLAGQMISLLALVLSVIPLYMTIRILFGPKEAFWGGMVFAVTPWFNDLAADVVRDPVFLFFFLWALYFGVCAIIQNRARDYVLTSVSCILASLFRIEAAVFPLGFLFAILVISIRYRDERILYAKGIVSFFAVPTILFSIVYTVLGNGVISFNRSKEILEYFNWFFNLDFLQSYRSIYDQMKEMEQTIPGWSRKGLGGSASETARRNLWLIYLLGLFQGIFKILIPYMLLPFIAGLSGRYKFNRSHFLLLTLTTAYVMGAYVFNVKWNFISTRYLMVPAVLFLPWTGVGISKFFTSAWNTARPRTAALFLFILFAMTPFCKSLDVTWREEDDAVKQAGLWLARQPESDSCSMICTDRRIAFYSDRFRESRYISKNDYKEMEQIALNGDFDILAISEPKKRRSEPLNFENYEMWKMHESHKNVALIYRKKS